VVNKGLPGVSPPPRCKPGILFKLASPGHASEAIFALQANVIRFN